MNILHPTKQVQTLHPRYVDQFSCIGPACEDSCCSGWRVTIDKRTFNTYRQSRSPVLAERFETHLKRNRTATSDRSYGQITQNPANPDCPFMEEKLCAIQRELGEDKLSHTCATYPRVNRSIASRQEQAMVLSCPEAARLALLQGDALDFVEGPLRLRNADIEKSAVVHGISVEQMDDIRVFCFQLMRTEGLELWQKLAVLALFCEQLTQLVKSAGQARIGSFLETFRNMVASGAIQEALAAMQPDYAIQASLFAHLWQLRIANRMSPVRQTVQKAVALGLGADPKTFQVTPERIIERYTEGVKRLPLAIRDIPFVFQNYLINEMFLECFPFGGKDPHDHLLNLITRYGLIRLMLAAQCADPDHLPDHAQIARTIQVACREYQHDVKHAKMVNSAMYDAGWDSLDKIYRFLRT